MKALELARYIDELLDIKSFQDDSLNGVQVGNLDKDVKKIGMAVDVSLKAIEKAAEEQVDFLIVHHGLFWSKGERVVRDIYLKVKALIEKDIVLYAAHLPLDAHPEFGNNAVSMKLFGFEDLEPFGTYRGKDIGYAFRLPNPIKLDELKQLIDSRLGCESTVWRFGKDEIQTGGYVSGGGLLAIREAIEKGLDVLITGEPGHWAYWTAFENRINAIFAGHYITERLGVKALGEHLSDKFGIPSVFIEFPTGY